MMRTLQRVLLIVMITIVGLFTGLFAYANLREQNISSNVKPAHLKVFRLQGLACETEAAAVYEQLLSTPGVISASVNYAGEVASVIYYPDIITPGGIQAILSVKGTRDVQEKQFRPVEGGCPAYVKPLENLIAALTIR